ncbi:MAG: protein-methionine-sulfoxide reductase catalytic subunit MsrP [Lautropia sp.]
MLIRIRDGSEPAASEVTPQRVYRRRRSLLAAAGFAAGSAGLGLPAALCAQSRKPPARDRLAKLPATMSPLSTMEKATSYEDITSYNNFYEFGTEKDDPARYAGTLATRPWTVAVEGEIARPKTYDIDELLKLAPMEDRIYRMRCVEGWSMVIPWIGYSLSALIDQVQPTGNAKFVEFVTLGDPKQMPGLRSGVLDWPYVEALRLDEAMHPLTLLGFGLYGNVLPTQNGAPVRMVVPWKYGFKSGKSIVRIRFTEKQPVPSWVRAGPTEYGFYSNVNPDVDHPRWSQATERRIGEDGFFARKRRTLPFNGYGEQVARLYAGMDLRKYF